MKKASAMPSVNGSLRQQAEVKLGTQPPPDRVPAEGDARALVHELQVHQIELELQNEELQRAQVAAELAADKYVELFDFAPVGAFVIDPQGVIREVNLAGAALLGRDRHLVTGQPFERFLAPDARAAFRALCRDVLADERPRSCQTRLLNVGQGPWDVRVDVALARDASGAGQGCRLAVTDITEHMRNMELQRQLNTELEQRVAERTADLQEVNEALRTSRLAALNLTDDAISARQQAEQARDALLREVVARKQAEEELRRVNRILRALGASDKALLRVKDEQEFLEAACRIVVEDCGYAMVWIGYAEHDAGKTVRPVADAGFEQGYIEKLNVSWADTERGHGPTATAIRTGQPVACRHMVTDPAFAPWRGEALECGYASSLVLPLREASQVFGAITLYSRETDPFTEAEMAVLSDLANELATGILTLRTRAERQRAEVALSASEEKARQRAEELVQLMDSAPLAILIAHDLECRAITGNQRANALFASQPGRDLDATFFKGGHELAPQELPMQLAMAQNMDVRNCELEVHLPGRTLTALGSASPLRDADGRVRGCIAAFVDITDRKRAESQLRASEAQFRLLFEANPNPMWVFDEETLRFLAVNDAALRHYGYTRDEFLALTVLDLRLPEDRAQVPEIIARQKGSKEVRVGVFRHLKKDGTQMDVEIVVSSIPFNGRPGRLVLANDITGRLQAERTLHIQAAALDAAVNSILITDAQGLIQWVNPAFCKLTGYRLDEVRGQTPRMLNSGRQPTAFYALLWRTILAGQPWQGELINRHKNGQCYPEQMTITPFRAGMGDTITHFIAIKEDISVRKLAEDTIQRINTELESRVQERTASLYAANERMRQEYEQRRTTQTALEEQMRIVDAFLAHSLTPLVFLDRQFNYVRVNAAFARACGKHVADFPEHQHFAFFPDAEQERSFAEVVQTGQPRQGVAQPLTFQEHPEGGVTYWDWTLVPLCDAAGAVEYLVYSLENVTERKQAEDQVRQFQDQLRALATSLLLTEERERKQLALVLHDSIGQMLALMRIKIAALEKRLQATDAVAEATALKKLAEDTIRQVRGLTTDLSPPILYQGGLAAALQDVGEHVREEFGVDFIMDADSCPEQLDETLRVLLYQSGRELLINVGKHAQADQVRLTIAPQGDRLRLAIEDDGVGFDPSAPDTKDKAKKSFGLFSIRERMFHVGGTMEIVSAPGQGTTVTLSVPVKRAATEERNG